MSSIKAVRRIFVVVFSSPLQAPTAHADPLEGRQALIIGNGAYKEAPIHGSKATVQQFQKSLEQLGFVVRVELDANQDQMEQALRAFGARLWTYPSLGFFYYIGHAVHVDGHSYLIGPDRTFKSPSEVRRYGVRADLILAKMSEGLRSANVIVIDAPSNTIIHRSLNIAQKGLPKIKRSPTKTLVVYSNATLNVDRRLAGKPSLFQKILIRNMHQSKLDILKVFSLVQAQVSFSSGGQQEPWMFSTSMPSVYFIERKLESSETLLDRKKRFRVSEAVTQDEKGNHKAANAEFHALCQDGFGIACAYLGMNSRDGLGTKKSIEKANQLFKRACSLNETIGCNLLGISYHKGKGLKKDLQKSFSLYQKACDLWDKAGCKNIGNVYFDGRGVRKDLKRAASFFESACQLLDGAACRSLGNQHVKGQGVRVDLPRSFELFQKGCSLGDPMACNNLGVSYYEGRAVSKDLKQAISLYRRACDGDDENACRNLAYKYLLGDGVKANKSRAKALFEKACKGGEQDACRQAKRL